MRGFLHSFRPVARINRGLAVDPQAPSCKGWRSMPRNPHKQRAGGGGGVRNLFAKVEHDRGPAHPGVFVHE